MVTRSKVTKANFKQSDNHGINNDTEIGVGFFFLLFCGNYGNLLPGKLTEYSKDNDFCASVMHSAEKNLIGQVLKMTKHFVVGIGLLIGDLEN